MPSVRLEPSNFPVARNWRARTRISGIALKPSLIGNLDCAARKRFGGTNRRRDRGLDKALHWFGAFAKRSSPVAVPVGKPIVRPVGAPIPVPCPLLGLRRESWVEVDFALMTV